LSDADNSDIPDAPVDSEDFQADSAENPVEVGAVPEDSVDAAVSSSDSDTVTVSAPSAPPPPPVHVTRLQRGIRKPKEYTDGTIQYGLFTFAGEPHTFSEAFQDERWRDAMKEEYNALMKNKTWHVFP
jgi:hypothetical protein